MGWTMIFAIFIGGGIGMTAGIILIFLLSDEQRWRAFLETIDQTMDNRLTRKLFDSSLGKWVNRATIKSYIRSAKFQRAQDVAVREGLVDEAVDLFATYGHHREAAALARRMGRDELADAHYRKEIDACKAENRGNRAAEIAEEAGFWEEAVDLMMALGSRESKLHAARIAGQHGMAERAVQIYLREQALVNAMQVAEENGMIDFVLKFCEESDNPTLHHFAADAAHRAGNSERGLEILEKRGYLHQAALFAREAGLVDRVPEIMKKIQEKKKRTTFEKSGGF
ncbi:MAG: hypothetical protein ACYTHM_02890 [Planctomycetota bacterium]|jgi:hypothetical protein